MNQLSELLNGKVAVVTGASGDLGGAISRKLAAAGARVILHCHTRCSRAKTTADVIRDMGAEAIVIQASLEDPVKAEKFISDAVQHWGRIDILVNNAGGSKDGFLMLQPIDDVQSVLAANLISSINCCKFVIKPMLRQGQGSIVNVSSLSGISGVKGQVAYSAAKSGVMGLTRALALEMGSKGIRVNAVAPGLIDSDIVRSMPNAMRDIERTALKRLGTPEEVANTVVFLASELSSYITGSVTNVNGGLYTGAS